MGASTDTVIVQFDTAATVVAPDRVMRLLPGAADRVPPQVLVGALEPTVSPAGSWKVKPALLVAADTEVLTMLRSRVVALAPAAGVGSANHPYRVVPWGLAKTWRRG